MRFFIIVFTYFQWVIIKIAGKECTAPDSNVNIKHKVLNDNIAYQVSILHKNKYQKFYKYLCSGVIVEEKLILTAAHCFNLVGPDPSNLIVISNTQSLSEKGKTIFKGIHEFWLVKRVILHPKYKDTDSKNCDVAKLLLFNSINFNSELQPIELVENSPGAGTKCKVINVESNKDANKELEVETEILGSDTCRKLVNRSKLPTELMLCCSPVDKNQNTDLVKRNMCNDKKKLHILTCEDRLAGIMTKNEYCLENSMDIYIDVNKLSDWVHNSSPSNYSWDYALCFMYVYILSLHIVFGVQ